MSKVHIVIYSKLPNNNTIYKYCKIKSFLNKQLYFSCEHSHNIFFCSTRKFKMSDLCHDGVHLSKKGQSKWLREVSSCIKRQLPVVKF